MTGLLIALVVLQALSLIMLASLAVTVKELHEFCKQWALNWLRQQK